MNISEVVKSWEVVDSWSIAPSGIPWCSEGNHVKLGDYVSLDNCVSLYNCVTLGNYVILGDYVRLGDRVTLGDHVTFARDLGIQGGYRHVLVIHEGKLKFVGGCHTFTFPEAREYWKDKPDRLETLLAVDFAEKLAKMIPECNVIHDILNSREHVDKA